MRRAQRHAARAARDLLWAVLAVALPLLLGQQVPVTVTQDLGAPGGMGNVSGLGPAPETSPEGPFRWSGPRVTLALPPLGYPLVARLQVKGERPAGQPPVLLGASAGGQALGVIVLPAAASAVAYRLPAAALVSVQPQLVLTSSVFQPAGDGRSLGTVFFRLETSSGPGPSLPAPWPTAPLLLSGVLLYALLRAATGRPAPALAATAGWGLALGLLNALARPWLVYFCAYLVVPPLAALLLVPWARALRAVRAAPPAPALPPPPLLTLRPQRLAAAVVGVALLVLAWHVVAPQLPSGTGPTDNLTWGVAFYGRLPWPLQALGVGLVLAALAWAAGAPVGRPALVPRAPGVGPPPRGPGLPATLWLVAGLGIGLGLLFPTQYSEGDSVEFDRKIPPGELWRERELLTFYLKARLWRVLAPWLPRPSQLFALVSAGLGGVYLGGAWLLGKALGRTRADAWVVVAALASLGNVLLFFGYVGIHDLGQVLGVFVLWACWQHVEGRVPLGTVGLLATLAVLVHGQAFWWGPMVVAAWLVRAGQQPRGTRRRAALQAGAQGVAAGLAVALVVGAIVFLDGYGLANWRERAAALGGDDGRMFMPLFTVQTPQEHYALVSWAALGAYAQEQLLTAPLALLTIGLVGGLAGRGVGRLGAARPALIPLAVGAASMLGFSLTWNPDIGPRFDWDLLSIAALPLTLVAIYLLLALPPGRPRRVALTAYLSVSAVHAAAWVLLHGLGLRA